MGLGISLGVLAADAPDPEGIEWLRRDFQHVNRVLAAHGLPTHEEPECLPDFPYRGQLCGFRTHVASTTMRRAVSSGYARRAPFEQFCPLVDGENPPPKIDRIDTELFLYMMDSQS